MNLKPFRSDSVTRQSIWEQTKGRCSTPHRRPEAETRIYQFENDDSLLSPEVKRDNERVQRNW